jgi:GAF domain-containing protein
MEVHKAWSLGLAGKKKTVKPDAELAALKRANARLQRQLDEQIAEREKAQSRKVRLTKDLRAARDRQTATSEILRVISGSPTDVQPVFDAIVLTAARLFRRDLAFILSCDATTYRPVATAGPQGLLTPPDRAPVAIDTEANFPSRAIVTRKNLHLPDWSAIELPEYERMVHERLGINSALYLPLLREGECIGLLGIAGKQAGIFSENEIALAESFRDQALIAIENTRLFKEVRKRTNDLSESLRQQTAVGDVLKIISRSTFDLQPVLDTLVQTAAQLCDAKMAFIMRREGDVYRAGAATGYSSEFIEFLKNHPLEVDRGTITGRAVLERRTVQILDTATDPEYRLRESTSLGRQHTALGVPLLRENEPIGVIVLARQRVEAFTAKQIELVTTFADQAVIAIENVRLFDEVRQRTDDLSESLQQQTATAEVLKVISRSAFDLQPVLDTLVESAARLCDAHYAMIFRGEGDTFKLAANHGFAGEYREWMQRQIIERRRDTLVGRTVLDRKMVHIPDATIDPEYTWSESIKRGGFRTMLGVPLLREGSPIGVIALCRSNVSPFTDKQIELVTTFADQAVIAIENVRLFEEVEAKTRDLTEALTYQTGSGNILKVIASSPTDVGPVLKAIVENACELCEADDAVVHLRDGDELYYGAHHGTIPLGFERRPINRNWVAGRSVVDKVPVHLRDVLSAEGAEFPEAQQMSRRIGTRTILSVPLLRENESIGAIILRRTEVDPFNEKQIALLQTFADQAVIALGNVRLFEEVQARTRDLTEALTYQTGSGNILKVIASSPTDVGPVLRAIADSACELCEAHDAIVHLREGNHLRYRAHNGPIPFGFEKLPTGEGPMPFGIEKLPINRNWVTGRSVVDKVPIHVHDVLSAEGNDFPEAQRLSRREGTRTILSVPMLREGESIGAIVLRRTEVHPFSDKQIALLQTFADQAVIAIGNVRLFEEVRERTEDLRESLDFQTATSDVLKVISSSPDTLQPVLDVIVDTSRLLCGTETSTIFLLRDERFHIAAASGAMPEYLEFLRTNPIALDQPGSSTSRAAREKHTVHIPDIGADPEFGQGPMSVGQRRALLSVPLMRERTAIGVITMRQSHLTPFTERQIEVVQTFADQAVIAISNVRLFEQVQQRTRELSQSLDDLRTAQDRLVQTEKLASLGQLTAGIAHEIKNPLNFVNNFSALSAELVDELNDMLKPATLPDKTRREIDELTGLLKDNLQKVVLHGKRADSIVKNMLLHSREGSGEHRPTDINALLDESLNLAYHGARAEKSEFNITLHRDFDDKAGMIELFPQEITRAFLNLISNGFYAAAKRKIEAGNSGFEPALRATTKDRGHSVEIRIRDNGTGIPAELKEKMFNPFFTTKPAGEGTGLGLSMSHDIIVKQHGGSIDVATVPGQFTEFTIMLPRISTPHEKSEIKIERPGPCGRR